jgi:diguanylate cyclase (GGDEF)-like protein/PAS domain S-box-containing protein
MIPCGVSGLLPGCELESILDSLPLAIFLKDRSLRYTWCNAQFDLYCPHPRAQIPGKSVADILEKSLADRATKADRAALKTRERQIYDAQITCPDGRVIDIRFLKIPAVNREGEVVGIIGIAIDLSRERETERTLMRNLSQAAEAKSELERFAQDLQSSLAYTEDQASQMAELAEQIESQKQSIAEQNQQITRLMYHDQNTGIHNRRYFFDTAPPRLAEPGDAANPGILAVADIDHFKRVNDTFGHAAGDEALRAFARVAAAQLPEEAMFCRIGGEEFAILLRPMAIDAGMALLDRVRLAVAELRLPYGGKSIAFTVSLGVTPILSDTDLDTLLRAADTALYGAKKSGRNRVLMVGSPA